LDERKTVTINAKIHHKLLLIKLYSDLEMHTITSSLLEEALSKEILQVVLMNLLGSKSKVDHVLKHLETNE